jgi:hypothetical protein
MALHILHNSIDQRGKTLMPPLQQKKLSPSKKHFLNNIKKRFRINQKNNLQTSPVKNKRFHNTNDIRKEAHTNKNHRNKKYQKQTVNWQSIRKQMTKLPQIVMRRSIQQPITHLRLGM